MLSKSSQVSKQSDALASPFPLVFMFLWARLITLIAELRYSIASTYMGIIIMTLGVLGDHLVI